MRPARARIRPDSADYLFGGFLGLAVATELSPLRILPLTAHAVWLLPFVTFQDLALLAALAWLFHGLLSVVKQATARRALAAVGWILCLLLALYPYLSVVIFAIIRRPLSYGLIVAGSDLRGIEASVQTVASFPMLLSLAFAPALVIVVAMALSRVAPAGLRRMRTRFYSLPGLALFLVLLAATNTWSDRYLPSMPEAFTNPDWTLVSSVFARSSISVTDKVPPGYLKDFQPSAGPRRSLVHTAASDISVRRPLNVVLIVMESVGTRRLNLYGAPVDDTPELNRLSRHAALFKDVHVSEPCTSCAMAALFSSVYPDHDWPTITRLAPALAIPGLPSILASHGYRTAFIHSGQLTYEQQDAFIRTRGFGQVIAEQYDFNAPRDQVLLPETMKWIASDPRRPFFVTIWTQDTHHPYETALHRKLGASTARLNDYLNAVDATDAIIGQLANALDKAGLTDQTLLVVTGDHGEAFGEHGVLAHGGTVYDEETQVPLMIVNPKLFPRETVVRNIAQQIDIAPTLIGLLGYSSPQHWQGVDLFRTNRPRRAYLFSGQGTASYGLVDGNFKYIYRVNERREELYDLTRDPYERDDLGRDAAYLAMVRRDHLRLEAWASFQNPYLARFIGAPAAGVMARTPPDDRTVEQNARTISPSGAL